MVAPESFGVRQAALLVHGLPAEARARVLARLSGEEAARLRPLLHELAELGVPSSLCREWPKPAENVPLPRGASALDRATVLDAADVARALEHCAPATCAAVLHISDWSWKQPVLEGLPELRRAEIRRYLRDDAPALAPAVAEALCERLCHEAGTSWIR